MMYSFKELYDDKFKKFPCRSGVYWVYKGKGFKKEFIKPGTGGFFKCRDPNVDIIEKLENKWVDNAEILYIGKSNRLQERIALYAAFGIGYPVAHWGGRYIWQIKDAMNILSVCWEEDPNPREREQKEISDFVEKYGKLPFANLRRGNSN